MRIGIDCRFVLDKPTGIGNYTVGLVRDLLKIDQQNQYNLILGDTVPQPIEKLLTKNIRIYKTSLPPMGIKQKLLAKDYINPLKLDVYHYPHHDLPLGLTVQSIVTVHHLVPLRFSTGPSIPKRLVLLLGMLWSIQHAQKVIAVSNFTAATIRRKLGDRLDITTIYNPFPSIPGSQNGKHLLPAQVVSNKYFLCVSEWRPHKNLPMLIKSFEMVKKRLGNEWKLVIVGSKYRNYNEPQRVVKKLGMDTDVWLAGKLDDSTLSSLYKNAKAMILPSKLEGFGYPIVEGMFYGLPIICSHVGSLPEIAGNAAIYVSPYDKKQIADAMIKIATSEPLVKNLQTNAKKQIKQFNGLESAYKTLQVYEQLANSN